LYISTSEELTGFLAGLKDTKLLAIDTEFLREKTYYPKLCLLQLATGSLGAMVDPLTIEDLSPLRAILTDPRVIKVFHAGDQDRAILFRILGTPVTPVFDTQLAAMVLGFPQQMGLAALVKSYCGVTLSKADCFTDWSQRPLTGAQMDYAMDDVNYLPGINKAMSDKLRQNGRMDWLEQDFARMTDPAIYHINPEDRWLKVKHTAALSRRQLASVRGLAAWRENTAQRRDYPRKWILSDELLVEIARREPQSVEELYQIRGLRERLGESWARDVVAAVGRALATPEEQWPSRQRSRYRESDYTGALDLMAALVHLRARENHISTTLLVSHDELLRLAAGERDGMAVLNGWRWELVGEELLRLLEGRVILSLEAGALKVVQAG
jgi:ribonuclease D